MADIYLTELEKVSAGQLGPKQTVTFLQPWILMLQGLNKYAILRFTRSKLPIAAKTVYSYISLSSSGEYNIPIPFQNVRDLHKRS